jgi:hypothetical protein
MDATGNEELICSQREILAHAAHSGPLRRDIKLETKAVSLACRQGAGIRIGAGVQAGSPQPRQK